MIVRNIEDREVLDTTYIAHGGALARMILDRRVLREIGFLARATLEPGRAIETHIDPMEEIYYIVGGVGVIQVADESRRVGPGDAVWIPKGAPHGLRNDGTDTCVVLVTASPAW